MRLFEKKGFLAPNTCRFSLFQCVPLGCWCVYDVLVVSSTMAWHCTSLMSLLQCDVFSRCRGFVTTELVPLQEEESARTRGVLDVDG